ncbi:hypothetical protein [Cetobacterium sp. 2A]|uniref:hypothetical protein n=1 Tax=Cetobacterium sp. 2A TaxID=2754723 RepID=UPI0021046B78|nr:hypothetical protein [Cetobacterium sp. 2A]
MNNKLEKIYELKNGLDHKNPLNQGEIKRIKENFIITLILIFKQKKNLKSKVLFTM